MYGHWLLISVTYWVHRIVRRAEEEGGELRHPIVLMHNEPTGNPATVGALPAIIQFFRARLPVCGAVKPGNKARHQLRNAVTSGVNAVSTKETCHGNVTRFTHGQAGVPGYR